MITGNILRDAILSGSNCINHYKKQVDELNVFPVPDGDTGTNMSMTISAAAKELPKLSNPTAEETAKTNASALLRGARGNSGVILSLLFRGFSKGLKEKESATGEDLANALDFGVKAAYKAVMKPTEGTMLTVARFAAEKALEVSKTNTNYVYVWEEACKAAEDALNQTPEMLPVLKKAGVVDAGGKGLLLIFQGMLSVFKSGVILQYEEQSAVSPENAFVSNMSAAGAADVEITFTYCTEFIVNKENKKDPLSLRAYLESMGDCVVVVDDEDIIKVHVHTNNPGNALQEGLKFGSLANLKIENMRLQHEDAGNANKDEIPANKKTPEYVSVTNENPFGFVSVAAGEGISALFSELGANAIVSGGQTMNPSTNDILSAIHSIPCETVFVLPNNKNIIMAAEQTIPLADRNVIVLHTKTIPQGLSAMLAFDPNADANTNQIEMTNTFERVQTGQITFAARDSDFDGHQIKEGELLALHNNKLSFTDRDLPKATAKLAKQLLKKDYNFLTVIFGEDVSSEQSEAIEKAIREKIGSQVEITTIDGGQPVYYVILSAE